MSHDAPSAPGTTHEAIRQQIIVGAGLMLLLRVIERLIGLASFAVLARLLVPDDFGLLGVATAIAASVAIFGQAGIDLALIQRRDTTPDYYDTAWTLNIMIACAVALLLAALAPWAATFFREEQLQATLYWLAAATFIAGWENTGVVQFRKKLDFRSEFAYRFSARMLTTVCTLAMAWWWHDHRALIAGYVVNKIAIVAFSYRLHPYRPGFSLAETANIFRFSGWVLFRNVLQGLNNQAASLLIARTLNVNALGYFTVGREISGLATSELQAPIRRALFPGFSAQNHDRAQLKYSYVNATAVMMVIGLPIPVGLILIADDAVRVLLGEPWLPAAGIIQILSIAGALRLFASGVQSMLLALGQSRKAACLAAIRFVIVVPSLAIGSTAAGLHGAAWALVFTAAIMLCVNFKVMKQSLGISISEIGRLTYRAAIAVGLMFAVVVVCQNVLPAGSGIASSMLRLCLTVSVGALSYAGALLVFWHWVGYPAGVEQHVVRFLQRNVATVWK